MATKILTLTAELFVAETFDTVIDQFWPMGQPSSSLEARANATYTTLDGKRILVNPAHIRAIVEDCEPEEH